MLKTLIKKVINSIARYHKLILLIFLVATISLFFVAKKIEINSDLMVLLPESKKSVSNLKKIIEAYGGEGYFIVVLKYNHRFKDAGLNLIMAARHLEKGKKLIKRWDAFPFKPEPVQAILDAFHEFEKELTKLDSSIAKIAQMTGLTPTEKSFLARLTQVKNELMTYIRTESGGIKKYTQSEEYKKMKKDDDSDPVIRFQKDLKKRVEDAIKKVDDTITEIKNSFSKPKVLEQAADRAVQQMEILQKEKVIKYVDYKFPVKWVKDRLFMLMDYEDVNEIYMRIRNVRKKNVSVLGESDDDLTFSDIAERYHVRNIAGDEEDTGSEPEYNYHISRTGDVLLLLLKPSDVSSSLAYCRMMHNRVDGIMKSLHLQNFDANITYGYTGRYEKKLDDQHAITKDITSTAAITFGLMALIMLILFRRIGSVLLVFLSLAGGIIWAIAFLYLTIGYLNIITAFLIAILSGLGIDFNIHFLYRYIEERKKGMTPEESLKTVYFKTFPAILASCLTTSAAFLCLVISPFKGFSHFGITIAVGLIFILISLCVTFPSVMLLIERFMPYKVSPEHKRKQKSGKFKAPATILAAGIFVTIFSILSSVTFDFSMDSLRNKKAPSIILDDEISDYFKMALWPAVGFTASLEEIDELRAKFRKLQKQANDFMTDNQVFDIMKFLQYRSSQPEIKPKLEKLLITLEEMRSIRSFLPIQQNEKSEVVQKIMEELTNDKWISRIKDQKLLKRIEKIKKYLVVRRVNSINEIPGIIRQPYINPDFPNRYFFYIYPLEEVSMSHISSISRYANDLTNFVTRDRIRNTDTVLTSETIIFYDIIKLVERDIAPIIVLTLLMIFGILYMDLRKFKSVLIVLTPLILGVIWILGFSRVFAIPFTFFNIAIVPTVFGMGIDDGIHFYHRYTEEGYTNVRGVLATSGVAMFFTSFTTMIGFGSLVFATAAALQSIGWMAIIGIGTTYIVSVTFLPALLQLLENRRKS